MNKYLISLLALPLFFFADPALAHQPYLVGDREVEVTDPEVSKAYYDTLDGQAQTYVIQSDKPFTLYVNALVPVATNPTGRYTVSINVTEKPALTLIATLPATSTPWKEFYEPFARDRYLQGPEFEQTVPAGRYVISVSNETNQGKYVLAIGKTESFSLGDTIRTAQVLPVLKKDFFDISPATLLLTIFGLAYTLLFVALGILVGVIYRFILRRLSRALPRVSGQKNIGSPDRLLRVAIGLICFAVAILTWSPLLMIAAGFCFYEAAAKWCGFYALIGRNTCPLP